MKIKEKINLFLKELDKLEKTYNLEISHEDIQGTFIIIDRKTKLIYYLDGDIICGS